MKHNIKYIAFYDFHDSKIERNYVTAATNKIDSICDSIVECGYNVDLISVSEVTECKYKFYKKSKISKQEGINVYHFSSWGGNGTLSRKLKKIWILLQLFLFLLFKLTSKDKVIVYHSLGYFNVILWAKKIKKFKMVLEVEEIYQDVSDPKYKLMAKSEYKMIEKADAYIFPTELLNNKLNTEAKPYIIIYGTYKVEPIIKERFQDGKIHVIYAGTFDPRKGGAAAAAAAAVFLPETYHIHICGFGTREDTENLINTIDQITIKSKALITYHGLIKGIEYSKLLQSCSIGLSTQEPSATFNLTSFPSKILSYMANGLSVLSVPIVAVTESEIGQYINYYKEQTPQSIAEGILNTRIHNNNREVIRLLNSHFKENLHQLLCRL